MVGKDYGKDLGYHLDHSGKVLEGLQQECNKVRFTFLFLKSNLPQV